MCRTSDRQVDHDHVIGDADKCVQVRGEMLLPVVKGQGKVPEGVGICSGS